MGRFALDGQVRRIDGQVCRIDGRVFKGVAWVQPRVISREALGKRVARLEE